MAEFKIGEVNNYFSQDDANSIFKANIDDNITEDQRDKKRVEIITEDLEKKIKEKQDQLIHTAPVLRPTKRRSLIIETHKVKVNDTEKKKKLNQTDQSLVQQE